MKRLSLDIQPSVHQALKLQAVREQTTMSAIVVDLLMKHVSSVSPLHSRANSADC